MGGRPTTMVPYKYSNGIFMSSTVVVALPPVRILSIELIVPVGHHTWWEPPYNHVERLYGGTPVWWSTRLLHIFSDVPPHMVGATI